MVENVSRKLLWIAALLVASILMMVVPSEPFRLGLDLQGGTRLVYRIDFDRALQLGEITEAEYADKRQLLQDTLGIIRERVDPTGTLEANFRPQGADSFVIEIPRTASLPSVDARAALAEELRAGEGTLTLQQETPEALRGFSASGGVIAIGDERIRYGSRVGAQLYDLTRGYSGTADANHAAGAVADLVSDDAIKEAIENPGALHFYLGATTNDFPQGTDLTTERAKVTKWIEANPSLPIAAFNRLPPPEGPPANIKWYAQRLKEGQDPSIPLASRLEALVQSDNPDWRFDGQDLKSVNQSSDEFNYPSVGLEMTTSASFRFGEFTEAHTKRLLGVVVNDEIVTLANIEEPLYGRFQIRGGQPGFTEGEVRSMVKVLRSGSFKIKPELEEEERIGASLGDHYIRSGAISAVISVLIVFAFMIGTYRRLGVYASLSLICNLILLMGTMAFLQATLTLPGVAGIVLTLGMAVDSNILIYERIREETSKGRKITQAAKNGFDRAMVTIIDSNLTTFISALILWYFGTGPVKGFASTLMIGIITTLFAALVVTPVLVHFALVRGVTTFKMVELIKETRIRFMSMTKTAMIVSAAVMVGGMALFAVLPDKDKLSIDFLGGFSVTVRTEEPQSVEQIRDLIHAIPGTIGEAEVTAVLDSGTKSDGYRQFRITYKSSGGASAGDEIEHTGEKTGESEIRQALQGILQHGPIEVSIEPGTGAARGRIYFEEEHPPADIVAVLADSGVTDAIATAGTDRAAVYAFEGTVALETPARELETRLLRAFDESRKDSTGGSFDLALPVPESTVVGAQVVGELRDKAIAAMLLSLFATVMYIRVRFAEYSYGIAAVAALVHDVVIVIGVLALADVTQLGDGEISLPMIAAFLTIIGYSINDKIVIFDRVRENLPRMKGSLREILDVSINQTLSRTLLTGVTTILAIAVLLVFNHGDGSVLEGFSLALLVGVIVGTYSSVFIASPIFLWLEQRAQRKAEAAAAPAS